MDDGARPRGLSWEWRGAALGAAYVLPAAAVTFDDVRHGLALAVGVLPATLAGLAPARRARVAIVVVGLVTALSMLLGGVLAGVPVLAVAALAALGPLTALAAARSRVGRVAMTLSLPLVGVGLSYADLGSAATVAALMAAGSIFAFCVALAWPVRTAAARAGPARAVPTLGYGVRLGAAGATAAAIGFALDLEHVGWACAAALLVMRPEADMQRLRSAGRIVAVAAGALAAVGMVHLGPPAALYAVAVVVVMAAAGATRTSRWYVTSAFTTFLVLCLLLYADPDAAGSRLAERLGETVLGVGIAYAFGLALPALLRRRSAA